METPDNQAPEVMDLRASLEAAFDAEEGGQVEQTEQQTTQAEQEPAEQAGRTRDEQGRFARAEGQEPAQAPAQPPVDGVEPPAQEPAPQPKRAPSSWKPEAQAAFNELPPHVQDEVLRRESDYHKGIEGYKTHAQAAQAYEKAVAPYMQTIQQLGVDPATAVGKLLEADHTLRYADPATKAQFFSQLAQQYGIDLAQVANPPQVDPHVSQLQQQLWQQRQELERWKAEQQSQQQSVVLSEIEKFAADPAHTHFDQVKEDMALLLQSGKAQSLKDAYDTAVWMRGDIRQSLIEQQRAEAQRLATEQAQAARAKAASASVKGSSPAASGIQPANGSLRDVLEAAFNDA